MARSIHLSHLSPRQSASCGLSACVLALALTAMAASLWMRDRLPGPEAMLAALYVEPTQTVTARQPFRASVGGFQYDVSPLYDYEFHGLVVSRHDAAVWWDITHREWGDRINVVDLCVVWGANLRSGAYRGLRYWSATFTCYYVPRQDGEDWRRFDENAIANNHLLTDDPAIAQMLRRVRVGDQVRVKGHLVEYRQPARRFHRGTSVVRTDRGNGACETVWVTEASLLRSANRAWHALFDLGLIALVLSVLLWWFEPVRARDD
jgi:hypothetical protein